ncbi:MAG: HNH endonuclease [Metamycoplasmataceae bacterium]|uniref:HNH endonuclease n=1 Tax=Mycoplasmopsis lipophila TaxID=2117 RepID=UPI0038735F0F
MLINRKLAMKIWNDIFSKNKIYAKDFAGRLICKSSYGDENSQFGWNIDHIIPQKQNGKSDFYNLTPCHILTNQEKGYKTTFWANNKLFQIRKNELVFIKKI